MTDSADHPEATRDESPARRLMVGVLLLAGAGLVVAFGDRARWTAGQVGVLVAALVLAFVPVSRDAIVRVMELARHPGKRARVVTALVIFAVAFAAFAVVPLVRGDEFFPRSHDEQAYRLQAQMLAGGRLWMRPHPLAEFFDTYYVLVEPVYAAAYFPGMALLLAPAVAVGLPYWILLMACSAATVALFYETVTRLIDGAAGLMGALLMLGCGMFREMAGGIMPHNLMLLLGVAAAWATAHWMSRPRLRWAAIAGAAAGWAAITRPVDAICYVAPLALVALPALSRLPGSKRLATLLVAVGAAVPFVALQLAFDKGVTGRLTSTPYELYVSRDQPQSSYGFYPFDATLWPESSLVQKHVYYDQFIRPALARHRPGNVLPTLLNARLPQMFEADVPHPLLIALLPISLLGLTTLPRVGVWAAGLVLTAGYAFFPFLLGHYLVVWLAPMVFAIALGAHVTVRAWPRQRWVSALLPLLVLASVVTAQRGLNPHAAWRWDSPLMDDVHRQLAALGNRPAVVLFRYDPRTSFHEEPVYNWDAAWPDDAAVVRAHDLGAEENPRIVRYYAERQPQRFFYLYDIATRTLTPLGRADELAAKVSPR